MKTVSEDNTPPLPPALLAQMQAAAQEEHRPTNEIVREAVERYLENRHNAVPAQKRAATLDKRLCMPRPWRQESNSMPEGASHLHVA
ncbi:MAG TPA: hypothetical protein VGL97_04190 [Bryobacteraceae bacterium]|jgi:hypothetical protein